MPADGTSSGLWRPVLDRLLPDRIVLTFHGIGEPGGTIPPSEAPYWVSERDFGQAIARLAPMRNVEITFDDGNASDVERALPVLAQAGREATFFVLAGRLGKRGALGASDLSALLSQGMKIGNHGETHIDFTQASDVTLRRELIDARARIEDMAGTKVDALSVPFGRFDARVLRLAAGAGYSSVHTSSGGFAGRGAWLVPRNTVRLDRMPEALLRRLGRLRTRVESRMRNSLRDLRYSVPSSVLAAARIPETHKVLEECGLSSAEVFPDSASPSA